MSPLFRRGTDLARSVDHLAEMLEKREEDGAAWQRAMGTVLKEAERAAPEEIRQTQERLAEMMVKMPLMLSALFALGSGALIERGADAEIPARAIFARTQDALLLATRFGIACQEEARRHHPDMPQKQANDKEEEEEEFAVDDIEVCVEAYGAELAERMGEEAEGWQALSPLSTAALAIATRSAAQRALARDNAAFMQAMYECPAETSLHCLRVALNLLEKEKVVVLHPALQRGYLIRISNIALNFELHTLLADALIGDPAQGWLAGQRPDPRVVAAAKDGPFPMPGDRRADSFPHAEGAFNLWNWRGLQADGQLSQEGIGNTEHWIWNEGQPIDIQPFEGTRVILLGPAPYQRSWNAGRFFPHLSSELEVVEKLSEQQVNDWLTRIVAAVQGR
ncbi:MAG TPA: hypothetical protein VHE33_10355 [Acidobacteriaceae bacterium]|nr:hypothetical protein [Acidobacteriaceae bacterium]